MSEVAFGCDEGRVCGELSGAKASVSLSVGEDEGADISFCLSPDFLELAVGFGQAFSFRFFRCVGADQDSCSFCGSAHS